MTRTLTSTLLAAALIATPLAAQQEDNNHLTGITGLTSSQIATMSMEQISAAILVFRAYQN